MSVYYMNDAAFELPETPCFDRTLTHVEVSAPAGEHVTLLVERTPYPAGFTLQQVVKNHISEASKSLRRYRVLFEREREIAGLFALDVGVTWRTGDGAVYTRQAHLEIGDTWLVIAGESALREREVCDAYVDGVIASFRLRE